MKTKLKFILFITLFTTLAAKAQTPSAASRSHLTHTGFFEIELMKDYESVKHLLESKPVENHYSYLQNEFKLHQQGTVDERSRVKDAYLVKMTEKKYHTIAGLPVVAIEVRFNKNKKITDILIMLDKTKKNIAGLKNIMDTEFGPLSYVTQPTDFTAFFCGINDKEDPHRFHFYTYDTVNEFTINDFLYIRYFMDVKEVATGGY